jgi:hypothetical protein
MLDESQQALAAKQASGEEAEKAFEKERNKMQAVIDGHVSRWEALESTALRVQEEGNKEVAKLLQDRIVSLQAEANIAKQVLCLSFTLRLLHQLLP